MNRSQLTFLILGKKYGFNLAKMVKFVDSNQYWSHEQIHQYQFEQLSKLIKHAYDSVSYYHRTMQAMGMQPEDFKSIEDVKRFPVIRKSDIMAEYANFKADNFQQYHPMERSTGGTTGVPFKYYNDVTSWGLNWATKIRTFSWGGYQFGRDQIAVLKGGTMLKKGNFSLKTHFWKYLHNYYTVPIINMTVESMDFYFEQIRRKRIRFIRGFPSALYVFAKHLEDRKISYDMKAIFCSAEMLYAHQREVLERVFNCGIIDAYGCGDGMAGANQCECKSGYHTNIETCYMEILASDHKYAAKGEEGEIVVTSLHDFAMPLIRYAPGDMAIQGTKKCECGRNLPTLDKIIGRTADLFELPNGRILNGLSIPFEDWADKIKKFQLIHEEPDLLVLKVVPSARYSSEDEKTILELIKYNAGNDIRINIEIVADIETTAAGKFKYVISKVRK